MKKYSALIIILYFLFPCAAHTYSQDLHSYESLIGTKSLEGYITFLANDETYGRATGGAGNQLAASMIRGEFEKHGLIPFYHQTYTQSFSADSVIGRNIIAVVQAQYYSEQYIVVSAHYDHLGVLGGKIFNGADDNASGVATLLNLARVFSEMRAKKEGPRKNIIFAAFDAKESNMAGSEDFVKRLPVPAKDIICNINIDQLGSIFAPPGTDTNYVLILGANKYKDFKRKIDTANKNSSANLDVNYDFYGSSEFAEIFYKSSDQNSFVKKNIPSLLITSGIHMHTYKPTDDFYFINYPVLTNRTRFLFHLIYQLTLSR
ncbi:MAG: M28 family peptidase [Bacteroidales bacterium]|jgi:Zn-dependent M28 family amino/carboxypeptidase